MTTQGLTILAAAVVLGTLAQADRKSTGVGLGVQPVDVDDIMMAFERTTGDSDVQISTHPLSVGRLEWEYIQRVLNENKGNVSATARVLNMHRRTLQRKLTKNPAKI